ncbi:[FeFe] hydrogenase H-cluster radical SAM maturase HydE [candidate division KSB1 bacterium]|nr:[FeFe] hydrogenase H-cluster radical SAM maturase HydE [candidate division KSB1 bacterium]
MTHSEIKSWLLQTDPGRLQTLYAQADRARQDALGNHIAITGNLEISNHCVRHCLYCGGNCENQRMQRFRLSEKEIWQGVQHALTLGCRALILESGEDYGVRRDWLASLIKRIKDETPLEVTLSLGERSVQDFTTWRQAGANRYLLRFETSDHRLYHLIHPSRPGRHINRLTLLGQLRDLGYEIGSGIMVGIPGQTYDTLARDIELFGELELDLIGVGPFRIQPDTVLCQKASCLDAGADQVPASHDMTRKVMALSRLVRPDADIPGDLFPAHEDIRFYHTVLQNGANSITPDLTPQTYRCQNPDGTRPDSDVVITAYYDQMAKIVVSLGRTLADTP